MTGYPHIYMYLLADSHLTPQGCVGLFEKKIHMPLAYASKLRENFAPCLMLDYCWNYLTGGSMSISLSVAWLWGKLPRVCRTKIQLNSIKRLLFDWVRQSNKIERLFRCEFDFRTNPMKFCSDGII